MAKQASSSKHQTFHIHAPAAQKVLLAGDFTDWQQRAIPMRKGEDGLWTASVSLPPGTHQYLFIIDGQWCADPACPFHVPNAYGGQNMLRQVT
jgi:1,4-alpha-glucan branching enzyme